MSCHHVILWHVPKKIGFCSSCGLEFIPKPKDHLADISKMISKCCDAPFKNVSGDEGTGYMVCTQCNNPCDWKAQALCNGNCMKDSGDLPCGECLDRCNPVPKGMDNLPPPLPHEEDLSWCKRGLEEVEEPEEWKPDMCEYCRKTYCQLATPCDRPTNDPCSCPCHKPQEKGNLVKAAPPCKSVSTNQTTCSCKECNHICGCDQPCHRCVHQNPGAYTKAEVDERIDGILSYLGLPNLGHMGNHLTWQQLEKALNDLRKRFLP